MTSKEFIDSFEAERNLITERYGAFMYFFISNIFNVNSITKIIEDKGYYTERVVLDRTAYQDIYFNNKIIGRVECTGSFPSIMFYKRNRKHARVFAEFAIEPIKGVHRILGWHDIKEKKLHCLAGGETVLHFASVPLTIESIDKFIKEMGLEELVEETKEMSKTILNS